MTSALQIVTIETINSESGTTFKLRQKVASGEFTSYSIIAIRAGEPAELCGCDMTYTEACNYLDWMLDGCPA